MYLQAHGPELLHHASCSPTSLCPNGLLCLVPTMCSPPNCCSCSPATPPVPGCARVERHALKHGQRLIGGQQVSRVVQHAQHLRCMPHAACAAACCLSTVCVVCVQGPSSTCRPSLAAAAHLLCARGQVDDVPQLRQHCLRKQARREGGCKTGYQGVA